LDGSIGQSRTSNSTEGSSRTKTRNAKVVRFKVDEYNEVHLQIFEYYKTIEERENRDSLLYITEAEQDMIRSEAISAGRYILAHSANLVEGLEKQIASCNAHGNKSETSVLALNDELLMAITWASSEGRGLEEAVTRQVQAGRESIKEFLLYQRRLKTENRLNSDDLRRKSCTLSRRTRRYARIIALGDIVAASSECTS
jgi:hypothetical protein